MSRISRLFVQVSIAAVVAVTALAATPVSAFAGIWWGS